MLATSPHAKKLDGVAAREGAFRCRSEVVVINHGRLVTHAPLESLMGESARRVRVRSPQADELTALLADRDVAAWRAGDDMLTVTGVTQEELGTLAFEAGIMLFELTADASNLEDVFFDLTAPPAQEVTA